MHPLLMGDSLLTEQLDLLHSKDSTLAYKALKILQKKSEEDNEVYRYLDKFVDMLTTTACMYG